MDESKVEDALARVLMDSYEISGRGTIRIDHRSHDDVARDEEILRHALFGERVNHAHQDRQFDGPIVWLEVSGKLVKCRVSYSHGQMLSVLRLPDAPRNGGVAAYEWLALADRLRGDRKRLASTIVSLGQYQIVEN